MQGTIALQNVLIPFLLTNYRSISPSASRCSGLPAAAGRAQAAVGTELPLSKGIVFNMDGKDTIAQKILVNRAFCKV